MNISLSKAFFTGKELPYMHQAMQSGHVSGNGLYTRKCQKYFEDNFGIKKAFLTTSCTDALEMTAILMDVKPGDEIIMPSYTSVSTAVAFARQGASIVFVDSREDDPGMDENKIEELISSRTKAIVPVHYAGVACDMKKIMDLADQYNLYVVEDAAQAIGSGYKGKALGSIGHFGCLSFHETKNIQCGEGGMLMVNDANFVERAEIIWEKGTNRAAFFRGEINKYGWMDVGSSFFPSDLIAAFLWAQLEHIDEIQAKRSLLWNTYYQGLSAIGTDKFSLPEIPDYVTHNAHVFYLTGPNNEMRNGLISYLKDHKIQTAFHFLSLYKSPYFKNKYKGKPLNNSDRFADNLVRLPLFYELEVADANRIINMIYEYIG